MVFSTVDACYNKHRNGILAAVDMLYIIHIPYILFISFLLQCFDCRLKIMNITRGKHKRLKVATNRHEANIVLSVQTQFFNNVLKHIIHIIMMNIYLVDSLFR